MTMLAARSGMSFGSQGSWAMSANDCSEAESVAHFEEVLHSGGRHVVG
jgi:hypothetical protein